MTDPPRFDPRGRARVWEQIAAELTARIEDGTYPPDSRLPGEMDICAEFGASRTSVRRALDQLREQGLVETVPGKGHYATRPEERRPQVGGEG